MHLFMQLYVMQQQLLQDPCACAGRVAPWCFCTADHSTSTVSPGLSAVASSLPRQYGFNAVSLCMPPVCMLPRSGAGVQVGEHESCGPGNLPVSGFTYNPETFMAAKIGVYNISWRDMGVPTLEKMMDIVQVQCSGGGTGC